MIFILTNFVFYFKQVSEKNEGKRYWGTEGETSYPTRVVDARVGDVQVSSGLPGVSGPSVSLTVTSSSVPRIVSDVRPSHPPSTLAIPVATCPLVSSFVLSPTPLSDFPLFKFLPDGWIFSVVPSPPHFFRSASWSVESLPIAPLCGSCVRHSVPPY